MGLIFFVPLFTKQRSRSKLFTIISVATPGHQDRQVQGRSVTVLMQVSLINGHGFVVDPLLNGQPV